MQINWIKKDSTVQDRLHNYLEETHKLLKETQENRV